MGQVGQSRADRCEGGGGEDGVEVSEVSEAGCGLRCSVSLCMKWMGLLVVGCAGEFRIDVGSPAVSWS